MIRQATRDDIDAITAMSAKFYDTTEYNAHFPFDRESVERLCELLIDQGVALIATMDEKPVGMIGLVIAPFMFNHDFLAANEVVWWVDPAVQGLGVGSGLLQFAERHCRERGAKTMQMVTLSNSPEVAAVTYQRAGFRHSETCFTKGL